MNNKNKAFISRSIVILTLACVKIENLKKSTLWKQVIYNLTEYFTKLSKQAV